MSKIILPTDFRDDILNESMNDRRRYRMITNTDGTVSFIDVSDYDVAGSDYRAAQFNTTNKVVNEINEEIGNTDISDIGDGTVTGALDALNSNFGGIIGTSYISSKTFKANANSIGEAVFNIPEVEGYTPILIWTIVSSGTVPNTARMVPFTAVKLLNKDTKSITMDIYNLSSVLVENVSIGAACMYVRDAMFAGRFQ